MSLPASEFTRKLIRQAYVRILNGRPKIVDKKRRLSVASVAEESGFSRAAIHKYYPDMIEKIKSSSGTALLEGDNQKVSRLKMEQVRNKELRAEISSLRQKLDVLGSKYAALILKYDEARAIINANNVSIFSVSTKG